MGISKAELLGSKYGTGIDAFTTRSKDVLEEILIKHCNEGVELMRKKIRQKARTRGAATLAERINNQPINVNPTSVSIATTADVNYWQYVDQGVKGVYNKGKAPQSKFMFRNLFTPQKMIDSFKQYIAATGSRSMTGKKLIRKNKVNQAKLIDREAQQMAVATKVGGIKPMNYVREANNEKRSKELALAIRKGMVQVIKVTIINN